MKAWLDYWHDQFAHGLVGLSMWWDSIKKHWLDIMVVVLLASMVLFMVGLWNSLKLGHADFSKPTPIEQSHKVSNVDTEVITPKALKVYKPVAKKKLALPVEVQTDEAKVVTSAVTVDYSLLHKQTVSSVLDTQTGETTTYVNEEPSPWLAHRSFGSASLASGFKGLNPAPVVRLQVTQDVIQIKSLTFGGVATLDSDGDSFVGVRGTYRW